MNPVKEVLFIIGLSPLCCLNCLKLHPCPLVLLHLGTVEVLAYPSLRAVDTLMAHTAGCYCIAIDPVGRCVYLKSVLSPSFI